MSTMKSIMAAGMLGALLVGATDAADGKPQASEKLARARSVRCEFPIMATGTWNKGVAQAETKSARLSVGFDTINTDDGTAQVIGTFGPSDIIVRLSNGTLHFVQSFREGPLYVTTIFPQETAAGKLQAVHSRHEYTQVSLPGYTSRPEQYYGECAIVE